MTAFTVAVEVADSTVPGGYKTVNQSYIFVVGGEDRDDEVLDNVECYGIESNTWREDLPKPNQKRKKNSTCQQGDYIYTFFGLGEY